MSISTKGGDKGKTSLWSGQRVLKSDMRVEAYGTIDELDSFLGEARHYVKLTSVKSIVVEVQHKLMQLMGDLASKEKQYNSPISKLDVDKITSYVHDFEDKVKLSGFVVPGNTIQSAKLDVCRSIARRAERRIISLSQIEKVNPNVIAFINRLSDLLFIMAREEEKEDGGVLYATFK